MVEAVSQVKLTLNKPVSDVKKDTANVTPAASNLERTPEKDSVSVNGVVKENVNDVKKSFTGWLIAGGAAIIGLGIYFLTRGKKGVKEVENAAQQAAQTVKKNVNEAVQNVEETVVNVVKKEEPKVKINETPHKVKTETEPVTEKVTVAETLAPSTVPTPAQEIQTQNIQPQPVSSKKRNTSQAQENRKDNITEKLETVEVIELKAPEKTKEKTIIQDNIADDSLIAAAILSDDAAKSAGKKAKEIGEEIADEASSLFHGNKLDEQITEIKPHSYDLESSHTEDFINAHKSNSAADDILDSSSHYKIDYEISSHEDDYLNVDGIADRIFDNNSIDDTILDFTSYADDISISQADDILDMGGDFLDSIF